MSGLIVLFESPDQREVFDAWSFTNAAQHRDINRLIFDITGSLLPDFTLDPFDPEDMNTWLYQHQIMHNAQNAVLGIAGYNLTELDWNNPGDLAAWVWNHAQEHYQAAEILQLG